MSSSNQWNPVILKLEIDPFLDISRDMFPYEPSFQMMTFGVNVLIGIKKTVRWATEVTIPGYSQNWYPLDTTIGPLSPLATNHPHFEKTLVVRIHIYIYTHVSICIYIYIYKFSKVGVFRHLACRLQRGPKTFEMFCAGARLCVKQPSNNLIYQNAAHTFQDVHQQQNQLMYPRLFYHVALSKSTKVHHFFNKKITFWFRNLLLIWRFPEMGVPPFFIYCSKVSPNKNHPAIGVPPF